jgi:hypothetical protein
MSKAAFALELLEIVYGVFLSWAKHERGLQKGSLQSTSAWEHWQHCAAVLDRLDKFPSIWMKKDYVLQLNSGKQELVGNQPPEV